MSKEKKTMFDLSANNMAEKHEAGYEFELEYVGEETGAFVKIRGSESPTALKFEKKWFNEQMIKQSVAKGKGKTYELSIEEAEEQILNRAVSRIISWSGIAVDGKEVPFTVENAKEILSKHTWISKQVLAESEVAKNFR